MEASTVKDVDKNMKLKMKKLYIYSQNGEDTVYNFSDGLTFIYGNVGTGKTTMLNLLMYCLGGEIIKTPAMVKCLDAVQLEISIQDREYRLFRKFDTRRILVENVQKEVRFWMNNIDLSDYIHYLCGLPVVNQAVGNRTEKKVKLTLANYFWFAYLKQSEMDNSFYQMDSDNIFKQTAAENVFLTLLKSNVMTNSALNEKCRKLRRRQRQYEEGREIFNYIDNIFEMKPEESQTKKFIINLNENITDTFRRFQILHGSKSTFSKEEVEELLLLQNKMDQLRYQYLYMQKKRGYYNELQKIIAEREELKKNVQKSEILIDVQEDEICGLFLECLQEVGFQGISRYDKVVLDPDNHYMPVVYNTYDRQRITFHNLSSGGKKNIFKICFALAIYRMNRKNFETSYLPEFFILDTPMKNISEREDEKMYTKFYSYLFHLFSTELKDVQLIIVDKEEKDMSDYLFSDDAVLLRMTREDPLNPPLFRKYRGI